MSEQQSSADSELDALRWRQLPAHLEEFQIDYVGLKRAIDADLADPQIVAALRTEPQTASGERLYTLKEAKTALEQAIQALSLPHAQSQAVNEVSND